ncbi:MAG: serine hydrolase domain-containing protein [Marinifilaceae bacterium]
MKKKYTLLLGVSLAATLAVYGVWGKHIEVADATPYTDTTTINEHFEPQLLPINQVINNSDSDLETTISFDKAIERFMREWSIKGASFALMKDDKLIYSKGYGFADEEQQEPMDVMHIFRIASVSKLITAVAVMKLVEEKQISLSDYVFGDNGILNDPEYLDYRDKRVTNITVEHLLRHQGGFSTAYGDPMFNPLDIAREMNTTPPADLSTMIRYILNKRLRYTPGQGTVYSNIGYGILSQIIEKVSGVPYELYVQTNILYPAGCFDMHLGRNTYEDKRKNEVKYYDQHDAALIPACDGSGRFVARCNGGNNIEALYGAGGWVASPSELLRFLCAINKSQNINTILSDETIDYMTFDDTKSLPIGWMHTKNNGEWMRTGTLAGSSIMMKQQSNGYAWVFVTNTSCWKGSRFPATISGMIRNAMTRVKEWPERDLFSYQFPNCEELLVSK